MSRRPFAAGLAAVAAITSGVVFMSGAAQAAGSSHGGWRVSAASAVPKAFKTFTSPARRLPAPRHLAAAAPRVAASGGTIYATTGTTCATETGTGAAASPFCDLQDAVNAAVSGDTIDVTGTAGVSTDETVTVRTSGISIVGVGADAWVKTSGNQPAPAIALDGVTDVTISNMTLGADGSPVVTIAGSSDVTLDSDYVYKFLGIGISGQAALSIDGASSHVTVSRTDIDTGYGAGGQYAAAVASGAGDITFAGDVIAAGGIYATGVAGLDVVGDTIQRGCLSGIDVEGASSGVHLENNLLVDGNSGYDYGVGGYEIQCASSSYGWAPDVTVAAGSSAAITADYNDFFYGTDTTTLYSGVSQGAHDTVDTVAPAPVSFRNSDTESVDAKLRPHAAAVGSANPDAPGELSSDFYGVTPYTSRGAVQYVDPNSGLAAALTADDAGAYSVTLWTTTTSAAVPLTVTTEWGDGTNSVTHWTGDAQFSQNHTYTKLGPYTITVSVNDNQGGVVSNSVDVVTAGAEYTAYGPVRVLDTRNATGAGGVRAPVPAGGTIRLRIDGDGAIPANAWAVALNLTVTDATADGYITAYPNGLAMPQTSNVNFLAGQTVANMAVVPTGTGGYIDLHNTGAGTVDLVADASGYYTPAEADGYTSMTPKRFLDTRDGTGHYPYAAVSAAHPVRLQIAGVDGVPAGVSAVAVNLTVADPSSDGYITAYPDGGIAPTASNVNFQSGQILANAAIVPVGADGSIDLAFTGDGSTRLVADVYAYYSAGGPAAYVPITPTRALDTRKSGGPLSGGAAGGLGLGLDSSGSADPSISALMTNSTVTAPTANGYLIVFPDAATAPNTSTLNFPPNQTVPNLTFATPGGDGYVDYLNESGGSIQLIVDVYGIFMTT